MSHPLFFRGVTFFYPFGNTSAVRLTEHLPPEQPANVLLLACGDPRHILYTVHTNETNSDIGLQKLDVTCCDLEAAVLARNALLFTLLADEDARDQIDLIWNIFYHFKLDQKSLCLLIQQCRKLQTLSGDVESWNTGPYSRFLSVCDKRTLAELHRFWSLWVATAEYPSDHLERFTKSFTNGMKDVNRRLANGYVFTSSRSAGPLLPYAVKVVPEQFRKFWSTGVTNDGLHSTDHATLINPTFAFSAAGEKFAVQYGLDPVAGFHLEEVFAASHREAPAMLEQKMIQSARSQFCQWCTSTMKLLSTTSATSPKLVIRMFAGDALMLCQAFSHLNSRGGTATSIQNSPWEASRIVFDEDQYGEGASTPAPTTFNVIDTSNFSDYVGLLNLLVAAAPLLSKSSSSMLYTETLVSNAEEPLKVILERLCGDMQTISFLLGVIPSAFLSRFTTHSNVHEIMLKTVCSSELQYYERVSWKAVNNEHPPSFDPDDLGRLLFGVYLRMFSDEDMSRTLQNMKLSATGAALGKTLVHYTRRTFVEVLYRVKSRVQVDWVRVMATLDDHVAQDDTLILGSNFYQEMCCHLHLLDIVTFPSMEPSYIQDLHTKTDSIIFRDWEMIPPVVTVVLVIPRSKATAIESELRQIGTPALLCEIRNVRLWNMFAHISAAYGKLEITGSRQTKAATIVAEEKGEQDSSLIVFFSVPSSSLMLSENATVGFRIRPSPRSMLVDALFTAPLENSRHVHILAEPPSPLTACSTKKDSHVQVAQEGTQVFGVQTNVTGTEIRSFTVRIDVTDTMGQAELAAGLAVKIEEMPGGGTYLRMDKYAERIDFPLPVDIANAKLRVVRKSNCMEVIAPLALSMHIKSEHKVAKRLMATLDGGIPVSTNVHRVNLDRCPPLKISKNPEASSWIITHISLMFSQREHALQQRASVVTEDTFVNLKSSLHFLLVSATGVQGPAHSAFALQDPSKNEFLAFIFVADVRLDVSSHTVVADAWVVPGTATFQDKLRELDACTVAIKLDKNEIEAWRYLLPLLVERCRTWSHRLDCEYPAHGMIPLYPDASADPEKSPFCSCGVGVGTDTFPKKIKQLAPYATRAAISPLFAVSYLEKVVMPSFKSQELGEGQDQEGQCRACGKQGGSLSLCGKCKRARYCSRECQVKDWKTHKKNCVQ